MVRVPSIRLGNYGNGTIGLKCSISPYDVTDLADDNNTERRSFNSEWTNLGKVKLIGTAVPTWVPFQERIQNRSGGFDNLWTWRSNSTSGWRAYPVQVPTGLTQMPIWEERIYDAAAKRIYDDFVYPGTSGASSSFSGARSYFAGPGKIPTNTIFFEPFISTPFFDDEGPSAIVDENGNLFARTVDADGNAVVQVTSTNVNFMEPAEYPPYPPYPAFPAQPATPTVRSIYVIYSNPLGDIS